MSPERRGHPLFARFYARVSPAMDAGGMAARRQRLLEGLTGYRLVLTSRYWP